MIQTVADLITGEGVPVGLSGKSTRSKRHSAQAVVVISLVLYGDGQISKLH